MQSKVICAVYGPHAQSGRDTAFSEDGQLQCEFSYAPFATPGGRRDSRGGKKDDERELSTLLRQTLESSVQVKHLVLTFVSFRPSAVFCLAMSRFNESDDRATLFWQHHARGQLHLTM